MSTAVGPDAVDSGIVLVYDAANTNCYPGSGSSITDISNNGYVGTLLNSVGFSTANGGVLTFNGTNQQITNGFKPSGARSYFIWIKYNKITGLPNSFSLTGTQEINAYNYIGIYEGGTFYYYAGTTGNNLASVFLKAGIWYQQGFVLNSDGSRTLYLNGVSVGSEAGGVGGTATGTFSVGCVNSNHWVDGQIAMVQQFNRPLPASEVLQNYNATKGRFRPTLPTGGTITLSEGYRIHTFTSSSTFATNDFGGQVDYLIVGGGGGGGGNPYHGGGGGAGGLLNSIATLTTETSYTVTVGGGGAGITGTNGSNSSFNSQTGVGGGGGGNTDSAGSNGGSGGGCGVRNATVGTGTSGQGNNGGAGVTSADFPNYGAGGGGGRGSTGANGTTVSGGDGGTGALVWGSLYAGGGGGSAYNCACSGAGGSGIGGAGAYGSGAGNGSTNTGSGGGGRDYRGAENKGSGNGGSGVVIIRYKYPF